MDEDIKNDDSPEIDDTTDTAPDPLDSPEVQAEIKRRAEEIAQATINSAVEKRLARERKKYKQQRQPTKAQAEEPEIGSEPTRIEYRQLDRVLNKLDLNGRQFALIEREFAAAYAAGEVDDVTEWATETLGAYGFGAKQEPPATEKKDPEVGPEIFNGGPAAKRKHWKDVTDPREFTPDDHAAMVREMGARKKAAYVARLGLDFMKGRRIVPDRKQA